MTDSIYSSSVKVMDMIETHQKVVNPGLLAFLQSYKTHKRSKSVPLRVDRDTVNDLIGLLLAKAKKINDFTKHFGKQLN